MGVACKSFLRLRSVLRLRPQPQTSLRLRSDFALSSDFALKLGVGMHQGSSTVNWVWTCRGQGEFDGFELGVGMQRRSLMVDGKNQIYVIKIKIIIIKYLMFTSKIKRGTRRRRRRRRRRTSFPVH